MHLKHIAASFAVTTTLAVSQPVIAAPQPNHLNIPTASQQWSMPRPGYIIGGLAGAFAGSTLLSYALLRRNDRQRERERKQRHFGDGPLAF